jgi:hypothetical protein
LKTTLNFFVKDIDGVVEGIIAPGIGLGVGKNKEFKRVTYSTTQIIIIANNNNNIPKKFSLI